MGERKLALDWLERSLAEGNEERSSIVDDPRFETLREDVRFARLTGLPVGSMDRVEGWRYDLDYLVGEVRRLHVSGPGRPAWPNRFQTLVDSIHDRVPVLDDVEVILELQRLMVLLGDGHTSIYSSADNDLGVAFPDLPVLFYWFEDGLHVVDGKGEGETLVGQSGCPDRRSRPR